MSNSFVSFISLIEFDRDLIKLEKSVESLTQKLLSFIECKNELSKNLEFYENQSKQAKIKVDTCELQMKILDNKKNSTSLKLSNCSDSREYNALKKELERNKKDIFEFETVLLEEWKDFDSVKAEFQRRRDSFSLENIELDKNIVKIKNEILQLEKNLQVFLMQREDKKINVVDDWLIRYDRMKSMVDDPVVHVENGMCSSCFYSIIVGDLMQLSRAVILECKSCFRLLYLQDKVS